MHEPTWANVHYPPIDYQAISYYSAPKQKKQLGSLDEVDPELRRTFDKLGISLEEQKRLTGVAVDAVFDSVSVATTFRAELAKLGIIFCSFSEAVRNHPHLVRKYLGSLGPYIYNFVTKRGKALANAKLSWTQVETGSAITWKYPSCILQGDNAVGEFYSVALTNNYQQADTGTKMLHIGKNTRSTIVSKGISAGHGQQTYRGQVKIIPPPQAPPNYSQSH